jgi:hypothetical protein
VVEVVVKDQVRLPQQVLLAVLLVDQVVAVHILDQSIKVNVEEQAIHLL